MYELQQLAAQVRTNHAGAAAELRHELEIQIVRIVRQVMRTGAGNSALARRVLAEVRQASLEGRNSPAEEKEQRILHVAHRICESVLRGLRPGPAVDHRAQDTVLN